MISIFLTFILSLSAFGNGKCETILSGPSYSEKTTYGKRTVILKPIFRMGSKEYRLWASNLENKSQGICWMFGYAKPISYDLSYIPEDSTADVVFVDLMGEVENVRTVSGEFVVENLVCE